MRILHLSGGVTDCYQRHGYKEQGQNLNYNYISFSAIKVLRATAFQNKTMSSPNHSTSDIEDAFSSMNILNYTSVSSDYFPASSGNSSFNSSENSKDNMIPPDPITPPAILTPSSILPPSLLFDPRYFFFPEELLPPKKQIHSSSTTLSNSSRNQICNLVPPSFSVYTPTPLVAEIHTIIKLQKKRLGQKDKIAFAHYRISDLEQIIEKIQARHQTNQEDL
ncbi:hypothetical protein Tco_0311402 [Tanacetum coccineum]